MHPIKNAFIRGEIKTEINGMNTAEIMSEVKNFGWKSALNSEIFYLRIKSL
jgi:hypothetical protein